MPEATSEARTVQPLSFFKEAGDAIGVTADFRPRVAKDDPEPEQIEPASEVVPDPGEAAEPYSEPDAETDADEPSEFDAILTPPQPEVESKGLDAPVLE